MRGFIRFFCTAVIPTLVLVIAMIVGWIYQAEIPESRLFATVIPLFQGKYPPSIWGHGKMLGTPSVPPNMWRKQRPYREIFLTLPISKADGCNVSITSSSNSSDAARTKKMGWLSRMGRQVDAQMPANGIGMCCRSSAYDDELVRRTIVWFLLLGGRLIDGAQVYGNHHAIGRGIREAIQKGVPRDEIFMTTKLWPSHYGYNRTLETVPKFLRELGLEYIDLVLMHAPVSLVFGNTGPGCANLTNTECRQETFLALSKLREEGIIRHIGVSNFVIRQLEELVHLPNAAPVAVNQIPFHPWTKPVWLETYEYCQQHGIVVTAYSSLGGLMQHSQASTVDTLTSLAQKYRKTVAQILLRWALQMNVVVIPGTGNPEHMRENLAAYSFTLSKTDMEAITELRSDESAVKFYSIDPVD